MWYQLNIHKSTTTPINIMKTQNWFKVGTFLAVAAFAFVITAPVAEAAPRHRVHKAKAVAAHRNVDNVERNVSCEGGTTVREKVVTLKNGDTVTKQTTVERDSDGKTVTQTFTNRDGDMKTRTTTVTRD